MCAALEVLLDSGHTLLVTDAEDSLSWERDEHQGWAVWLYPPAGDHHGECLAAESTADSGAEALVQLAGRLLAQCAARPQR